MCCWLFLGKVCLIGVVCVFHSYCQLSTKEKLQAVLKYLWNNQLQQWSEDGCCKLSLGVWGGMLLVQNNCFTNTVRL